MKNINLLCGLMMLAGISVSGIAQADRDGHGGPVGGHGGHVGGHGGHVGGHGGHVGFEFLFGVPYSYPYYPPPYYYPYSYYPPVMAAPSQPPVYIEQGSAQPAPQQAPTTPENYYWYHCDKPDGYYPYIKECLGGWQKVVPTPPPQQ